MYPLAAKHLRALRGGRWSGVGPNVVSPTVIAAPR